MLFTPLLPSAGPTGGEGEACPAPTMSLTTTSLAIALRAILIDELRRAESESKEVIGSERQLKRITSLGGELNGRGSSEGGHKIHRQPSPSLPLPTTHSRFFWAIPDHADSQSGQNRKL